MKFGKIWTTPTVIAACAVAFAVGTASEKFDGSRFVYTCQPKAGVPR